MIPSEIIVVYDICLVYMLIQFGSVAIMTLPLFVDEMLPKLDIANCSKYGLQLMYHSVFYVGSNCYISSTMF